jgi:hypothetical protein
LNYNSLKFIIIIFLSVCIFDPADKILGLKVELYIACWVVFISLYTKEIINNKIKIGLIIYIFGMILIPIISMFFYQLSNNIGDTQALSFLKSHIYITFAFLLFTIRMNIIPYLSILLTVLSIGIISVSILTIIFPFLDIPIRIFGIKYGILLTGTRAYSEAVQLRQIYFVTSPMIVIAIAHYFHKALNNISKKRNMFLTFINLIAITLAGTRSNLIGGVLSLSAVLIINSKNKILAITVINLLIISFLIYFWPEVSDVLSLDEDSNSVKIRLLTDYKEIFSNSKDLLFGQGFGSYYYFTAKSKFDWITELSYLEIIRTLGLLLGIPMLVLIFFPIIYRIFSNKPFQSRIVVSAYMVYLAMSSLNPLIFSSLGMTIISALIANIYISQTTRTV